MAKTQTQEHIVAIPPGGEPPQESRTSKIKNFFRRDKKAKIVLSERDARILEQVKRRAKVLDTGVDLGCTRIGLDPIIGLIPVAGDAVSLLMAMRLIHTAQKANIPKELVYKMLFNVGLDFGLGLVPVVGDLFDFMYKANDKNAKLFEEFLFERAARQAAEAEAAAKEQHHHHSNPLSGLHHSSPSSSSSSAASPSSGGKETVIPREIVIPMEPLAASSGNNPVV
ncbi:hypothetical protein BGZ94_009883 [Podila epigama]|nr:hypothetical protein BGZ94_009883 [Podila epigama]